MKKVMSRKPRSTIGVRSIRGMGNLRLPPFCCCIISAIAFGFGSKTREVLISISTGMPLFYILIKYYNFATSYTQPNFMKHFFTLFALCMAYWAKAQTPQWAFKVGGSGTDAGISCQVAPNGNVYLAGNFTGTIDLNPGLGTYNVTSVGSDDIFIACYTPAGTFLWGFGIGGANRDNVHKMAVDASNNVMITGFFQGGMDFDPGAGTAIIPFAGGIGSTGDGYIAKYNSAGGYMWAKDLGGTSPFDYSEGLAVDEAGNIYVGGTFNTAMTVTPTLTFTSSVAGPGYLIKYDPSGNIMWGHNLGEATVATNLLIRGMVAKGGFIYACGYFQGNANFCPWGSSTYLNVGATGGFVDAFVAKYDTAGNIVFARQIAGSGAGSNADELSGIGLDAAGNIYVAGWGSSASYLFDAASPATTTLTPPGGGGNNDIILAKYSGNGVFQWARLIGSGGADWVRWGLTVAGGDLYIGGKFQNTVDFDPSAGVANLVSAGGEDIFLANYDLAGNYKCAFRIGSSVTGEQGGATAIDTSGALYLPGTFGGTGIDFDPSAPVYPLSSAGSTDAFLAKYIYTRDTIYGTITGDTICSGSTAYITVNITSGPTSLYSVTFTNGTSTFTASSVTSGVPIPVTPTPPATTAYWVSSATYVGAVCQQPLVLLTDSARIRVDPTPTPITGNAPICVGSALTLTTAVPGGTWSIAPVTVATVSSTGVVNGISGGTARVTYANSCGSVTATVTVNPLPAAIGGNAPLCAGASVLLTNTVTGGTWSVAPATVATISPTGMLTAVAPGTATVTYTALCGTVNVVATVNAPPAAITGNAPICPGSTLPLTSSTMGGTWSMPSSAVITLSTSGVVTALIAGTATVSYSTTCGSVSVIVTVNSTPGTIAGNAPVCSGGTLALTSSPASGTWSIAPAGVATVSATGIVTAIGSGTATVSYTTLCGTSTTVVTVNTAPSAISGNTPICIGGTLTLINAVPGGTWSIPASPVASISSGGLVTGWASGTVTASYTNACGTATTVITVNPATAPITGTVLLCPGGTTTLTSATTGGTWAIAPTSVATIGTSGDITPVAPGTAIVTYTAICGFVTATVTVNSAPGTITGNAPMCVGSSISLSNPVPGGTWGVSPSTVATISTAGVATGTLSGTATVTYTTTCGTASAVITVNPAPGPIGGNAPICAGSTMTLTNAVAGGAWSISPTSVATISATGLVTAVASGTAVVSYTTTCGSATAVVTVNVSPGPIAGIGTLCPGGVLTLSNSTPGGTWSISPTGVATISATGDVTATGAGTATVTYTSTCGTVTDVITVNPVPGTISGNIPICPGNTTILTNPVPGGTWSISPTSISTISAAGLVTGVAAGTATASYTMSCGIATVVVTVNGLPGPIGGISAICPGSALTVVNSLAGGTWSIAPTTVATISSTGDVTAIAPGTAIVTYTTTCGTASGVITVNPVPGIISGNAPLCPSGTVALSNSVPGGVWSITPATVATISGVGVVTGISAGTATVSYTTICGSAITIVTVNGLPGPIGGVSAICPGNTVTLTNSLAGGTWSIAPATVATITPTGDVTAISAGTATVTYTTVCGSVTAVVTVSPLPAAITGSTPLCPAGSLSLASAIGGGAWSISPASVATITAGGAVTAVSAGAAIASYTTACGTATTIVTVNPLPGPITGNLPMCPGGSITLSNSVPGGTWTASGGTATVSAGGIVIAAGTGTTTISYTTSCGTVIVVVTVLPTPSAIGGNAPLCPGTSTALTNAVAGGTWTIAPSAVATIASTGVVTGIGAGTAMATYITACGYATAVITVNPVPGPISGAIPVCQGGTLTLSNTVPGGTWSILPLTVASISSSGVVSATAAGTAVVTYTNVCGSVTTTINILPLPGAITGPVNVCPGSTIALSNSAPSGVWAISPASIASIGGLSGVVTGISSGTAVVTYTTTCGTVTTIITVDPLPGPISGNTPVCAGNTIGLSNSLPGGTWSCTPTSVATISATGVVSAASAGMATVTYTTACGLVTASITVNPSPAPISGNIPLCPGSSATLSNIVTGGVWSGGSPAVATLLPTGTVAAVAAGTTLITYALGSCSTTATVTVNPKPAPLPLLYSNPVCGGAAGSITIPGLAAGAGYTVHYTSVAPITATVVANASGQIILGGLAPGTYSNIVVVNGYGCGSDTTGPVTLVQTGLPTAATVSANEPCTGDSLKLNANSVTPGVSYHWSGPGGYTTTGASVTIYPAAAANGGTYTVTVVLGTCMAQTTLNAIVHPQPLAASVAIGEPQSCYGADGWIEVTGMQPGETYTVSWLHDGSPASGTFMADASGKLRITGLSKGTYSGIGFVSMYGCASIPIGPYTLIFGGTPPAPVIEHNNPCVGQTLMLRASDAMPGGTYSWAYPDGGTTTIQAPSRLNATISMSGTYSVTYSVNNCPSSAIALITVYPNPLLINMTPDQTIKWGESVQLFVEGAFVYRWAPNDGSIDNPNINNPVVSPEATTRYYVYGSNEVGCIDTATIEITVNDDADEFIPTAFTPNGDGLNDVFRIRRLQRSQKLIEFSIYNRYGERVYHNEYSPDAGWDGTYKDQPCDMGTYFYQIILGLRDGTTRMHKGDVTLIR